MRKYQEDITNCSFKNIIFDSTKKCITQTFRLQRHNIWNIKEDHLRNISLLFVHTMKVISDQNSFVTNSLQNTFIYVPQKKGLKRHEGRESKLLQNLNFLDYPFNVFIIIIIIIIIMNEIIL